MEGGDSSPSFSTEIWCPLMGLPVQEAHEHTGDSPMKDNKKRSRVWSISPMRKDREMAMISLEEERFIGKISVHINNHKEDDRRMEQILLSSVM